MAAYLAPERSVAVPAQMEPSFVFCQEAGIKLHHRVKKK